MELEPQPFDPGAPMPVPITLAPPVSEPMPPGPAPGGLASFDAGSAAQNLAAVGQQPDPTGLAAFDSGAAAQQLAAVGQPVAPAPAAPPGGMPTGAQVAQALGQVRANARGRLDPERAAAMDQQAAVERAAQAQTQVGAEQQGAAEARAAGRDQMAEQQQAAIAEQQRQAEVNKRARSDAEADVRTAEDQVKGFKFHDYWSTRPQGDHLMASLGVLLMGAGGGTQAALAHINQTIDRDFERQKQELATKEKLAQYKREGVRDLDQRLQQEYARLDMRQALARQAVADKAESLATRAGGRVDMAEAGKAAEQLRAQAAQARTQAEHNIVESARTRAQTSLAYAEAGKARAEAGRQRALATGGDPRLQHQHTLEQLAQDRVLRQDVTQWATQNGAAKAIEAREKLQAIKEKLSDPNVDPATVALSLMEFDKAAKGGTATQGSFNVLMGHLGGVRDKIAGWAEGKRTGNLSKEQLAIMRQAVDAATKASDQEGGRLHQSYMDRFYGDPRLAAQKDTIASESDALFGRFGFTSDAKKARQQQQPQQSAPAASADTEAAKQWLSANPNDPRAAAVRAKLQAMGGR